MTKFSFAKLIRNAETYELLAHFLEDNHNLELLNFLEQVNDFNLLISNGSKMTRAKTIFETFIKEGSQQEVNIDSSVRKSTTEAFENAVSEKILPDEIFRAAYRVVCLDLIFDAFPRFEKDQKILDFFSKEKRKMTTENFEKEYFLSEEEEKSFMKEIDNYREKDSKNEIKIDVEHAFKQHDPSELLTVNIDFTEDELDSIYSSDTLKPYGKNYL